MWPSSTGFPPSGDIEAGSPGVGPIGPRSVAPFDRRGTPLQTATGTGRLSAPPAGSTSKISHNSPSNPGFAPDWSRTSTTEALAAAAAPSRRS